MNPILDLHGKWNYELEDQGREAGEWVPHEFKNQGFLIPGTTASNRVGDPVVIEREMSKEAVKRLREEYKFLGVVYYQTDFALGDEFKQKEIELYIERVLFESVVYVDGKMVSMRNSLSVPHTYNLTEYVEIGRKHTLTVRVDNRDVQKIGPYPSAYTDETQTIWNGMVGRVEIIGRDEIAVKNVVIGLKAGERRLLLSFETEGIPHGTSVIIDASLADGETIEACWCISGEVLFQKRFEFDLYLDESIEYWDEFSPKLYELKIKVSYSNKDSSPRGSWCGKIGLREISTKEGLLYINGIRRFLRGNIDCCVYPLTAHPPMDHAAWLDICRTTKEYGLNHIRFHSWCPPEAAFQAADETGLYLQVEGPVWMDNWTGYTVGCYEEHHVYLPDEASRIVFEYSHHPSFCFFSNGNELNGDFSLLERIIDELKKKNPYLLYTLSTNWDRALNPQDDLYIAQSVDGIGLRGQYFLDQLVEGTELNYNDGASGRSVPILSHEVGQYVVYPDINEIPQYTGVLKPVNLESIQRDLCEKSLDSYVPDFVFASGKLSALLYKAELEAALRTEHFSGIQLLGLHDFPGQSTATVGLLNCFYDNKKIISSEEYRSFCNDTVLLINMPKYRYLTTDEFRFELQIAHYGNEDLVDLEVDILLEENISGHKEIFWSTSVKVNRLMIGLNKNLLFFKNSLFNHLKGRKTFTLTALIRSMNIRNSWDIWVYEAVEDTIFPNSFTSLDQYAIGKLKAGENVILFAKPDSICASGPGKFFPVFWSPVHFTSQDPCGMIIDSDHPLFKKYYPTKNYADIEWKNLLDHSFSINIDSLKGFEPITKPVPNFFHNHKFTNLFEANILNGKIIICSLDLNAPSIDYPEIRSFKKSLKDYFVSADFCPSQTISLKNLQKLFKETEPQKENRENVALHKPASSDSEMSASCSASKGNDGNPMSKWLAADMEPGHYWMVDLEKVYAVEGTKVKFHEKGNFQYVIHTSIDGMEWHLIVNRTDQTKESSEMMDLFKDTARYVKITYNGLSAGLRAGHQEFEVYVSFQ